MAKARGRRIIPTPPDSQLQRNARGRGAAGRLALAAAVLLAFVSGCGYTASPALLPPQLKSVAIPVFENGTPEARLEEEITNAVILRFVQDNHLKVVDEKTANSVIRGKVTQYKNSVFGFTNNATSNEYRVTVAVEVTFKDLVKNRELWSGEIVKTANYYVQDVPGQAAQTELDGRKEAINKISDEILSRSVEGW